MYQGSTSLKWYSRLGVYKNSTGSCSYNPSTCKGRSYNWTFCAKVNNVVVFNSYRWSSTTSCHQDAVKECLKQSGVEYTRADFGPVDVNFFNHSHALELFRQLSKLEIACESARKKDSGEQARRLCVVVEIRHALQVLASLDRKLVVSKKDQKRIRALAEEFELNRISDMCSEGTWKYMELSRAESELTAIDL